MQRGGRSGSYFSVMVNTPGLRPVPRDRPATKASAAHTPPTRVYAGDTEDGGDATGRQRARGTRAEPRRGFQAAGPGASARWRPQAGWLLLSS